MFAYRCMNHTTIKQYSRGIGDVVEDLQRLFILGVVIVPEGLYPSLDFLSMLLV